MKTDDGQILLGRMIPERAIDETLRRLGANRKQQVGTPEQVIQKIMDGYTVRLANGWKIEKRRVSGENRIELVGDDLYRYMGELNKAGVFTERINFQTRFFIPTGEKAVEVFKSITKYRPILEVIPPKESASRTEPKTSQQTDYSTSRPATTCP